MAEINPQDDPIAKLKEEANIKFRAGEYFQAKELYTKALSESSSSTPLEAKRIILSNRSQTFLQLGDLFTALHDIDRALSDAFTKPSSPKEITLKLHFRRAKIYSHMARYIEAQKEFGVVETLRSDNLSPDENNLKKHVNSLASSDIHGGSSTKEKNALIRAVDSRGLILPLRNRYNFPFPPGLQPSRSEDPSEEGFVSFDVTSGSCNNISIPLHIVAPGFIHSPDGGQFHSWTSAVSENTTIGSAFEGMFEAYACAQPEGFVGACKSSALYHENAQNTIILVMTYRGRILVVPPETSIKSLVEGARWPKVPGSPDFEEKKKIKPSHHFEYDGIELVDGWYIDIFVLLMNGLDSGLKRLEGHFLTYH